MDVIYLVYENSDKTEGRGPDKIIPNSGFFLTEKEAWDFADTQYGIMGRKPSSGSWKNEKYPDVYVVKIYKHDSEKMKKIWNLESQIKQLQNDLAALKYNRCNM